MVNALRPPLGAPSWRAGARRSSPGNGGRRRPGLRWVDGRLAPVRRAHRLG
ncbi:hypothetical protein PAI11_01560 [Patulibacter medicamentivorans]|uniref:Uncharacterized protein n=1 Tax=Patulibacter medicamentivorans TaxID=1097667 RepID=H0E050_9ACTN|nr:hypothetical protein PAI11_01560 [Patulibacter medicamentivorans]